VTQPDRTVVSVEQPPELLFPGTPVVHLCNRDRQSVPFPNLPQTRDASGVDIAAANANGLYVRVSVPPIAAPARSRVPVATLIQKSVGRQIIVQPHDIRWAWCLRQII
jgi:hypothetical protein